MIRTDRLLLVGLVLLLLWAHLATVGGFKNGGVRFENRRLAPWPDLREGWVDWPRKVEAYVADRMSHRQYMIALNSWVRAKLLRSSTNPTVLQGRGGWLFHYQKMDFDDFAARSQYTPSDLRRIRIVLEERRDWLAQRGIRFVVGIAPTKQTVYPEMVPAHMGPHVVGGRRVGLLDYLKDRSPGLNVVDFTDQLIARKRHDQVYYATDTHWNYLGALIGYREMLMLVPDLVPTDQLLDERDMLGKPESRHTNLNKMLGLADQEVAIRYQPVGGWAFRDSPLDRPGLKAIAEQGVAMVHTIDRDDLPTAYVLGDSFVGWNSHYISQHFKRTVITNTWGAQWTHRDHFPVDLIELENPDVVFLQLLENRIRIHPGGAYLVNLKGQVNAPCVRQARLARLFGQVAEASRLGVDPANGVWDAAERVVTFPFPDTESSGYWIAKIELNPRKAGWIEIWDHAQQAKLVAVDEVAKYKFDQTDRTVYLCVPGDSAEVRLRITPVDAAAIRAISWVPHHDL